MSETCLIIGASHAGAQLAVSLRQEGWQGEITLISEEASLPYHRPPLSKGFLLGKQTEQQILIRPEHFYEKQDIRFLLNKRVTQVDREKQTVTLEDGKVLTYSKLVFCTGARVRQLPVPGAESNRVRYLRALADIADIKKAIAEHAKPHLDVLLIGGGYIGLEAAAALQQLGHHVTVLESEKRVLQRVTAEDVSTFYSKIHTDYGVSIAVEKHVTEIIEADNMAAALEVKCADGDIFKADLVIVGIGVIPNTELAEKIGLKVSHAIEVDDCGGTADPNIFAAGDCAIQPNQTYGRALHIESVPNAMEQAKSVAANICGKQKPVTAVPWFWSDQYDIKLQIAGVNAGYDETLIRGDSTSSSFVVWYFKNNQLIAADCINRPKEFMFAKQLLAKKINPSREQLSDELFDLKTLL